MPPRRRLPHDDSEPSRRRAARPPAPELIAAGFELENADAGILHQGMNLADIAHLLDLSATGVIPPEAARSLLALLLATMDIPAAEFPYDPANGEPYNSRERYFVSQVGDVAGGCTPGGRAGRRSGSPSGCACATTTDRSRRPPSSRPSWPRGAASTPKP